MLRGQVRSSSLAASTFSVRMLEQSPRFPRNHAAPTGQFSAGRAFCSGHACALRGVVTGLANCITTSGASCSSTIYFRHAQALRCRSRSLPFKFCATNSASYGVNWGMSIHPHVARSRVRKMASRWSAPLAQAFFYKYAHLRVFITFKRGDLFESAGRTHLPWQSRAWQMFPLFACSAQTRGYCVCTSAACR